MSSTFTGPACREAAYASIHEGVLVRISKHNLCISTSSEANRRVTMHKLHPAKLPLLMCPFINEPALVVRPSLEGFCLSQPFGLKLICNASGALGVPAGSAHHTGPLYPRP
eukprot:1157679-Pelagomonas_calceolata.AAC.8